MYRSVSTSYQVCVYIICIGLCLHHIRSVCASSTERVLGDCTHKHISYGGARTNTQSMNPACACVHTHMRARARATTTMTTNTTATRHHHQQHQTLLVNKSTRTIHTILIQLKSEVKSFHIHIHGIPPQHSTSPITPHFTPHCYNVATHITQYKLMEWPTAVQRKMSTRKLPVSGRCSQIKTAQKV